MGVNKTGDPLKHERLDEERNAADQKAGRGYDYDDAPRVAVQVSEHVSFVYHEYGCMVCGEPVAIVTPKGERFCGPCLRQTAEYKAKKAAKEERYGIRHESEEEL